MQNKCSTNVDGTTLSKFQVKGTIPGYSGVESTMRNWKSYISARSGNADLHSHLTAEERGLQVQVLQKLKTEFKAS